MKKKTISIRLSLLSILANQKGNFMGDGGDGGAGDGGAGVGGDGGAGGSVDYNYPEGFDDKLKGNPSLMSFAGEDGNFNVANLMKSYVHTKSMVGKTGIQAPDETFTDDQWSEFYNKTGRPEDIKEYGVKNNLGEGQGENEVFFTNLKETAYKAGLSTKQAQVMSDFVNQTAHEGQTASNASVQEKLSMDQASLKAEWGESYDVNNTRAFSALEKFASSEEIGKMKESGLLNNPMVAKLFNSVAKGLLEDNFDSKAKGSFGIDSGAAREKRESFYIAGHPFMNSRHPEHAHYKNEMLNLNRIITSGK